MNEGKKQEALSVFDALKKEFGDDPDFLRKVKRWEEIERTREIVLSRFPPPTKSYTLAEIGKGIEENDSEAISALYRFAFSEPMIELMFCAWFRDDIHKLIAKHAGSQMDDYFLRCVTKLPTMTSKEFLKLHKLLRHQGSEDDIQTALMELFKRWTTKEPYLTLLEKVIAGEFAKILPAVVGRKRVDEYRKTERFVSYDKVVETANGSKVSMLEFLMSESESSQTQPEQFEEELTEEQRQQLEQLLGKTGLKILEYRLKNPEISGLKGEKKEIAQALKIAESTVGEYIGRKKRDGTKHVGILEKKAEAIQKII